MYRLLIADDEIDERKLLKFLLKKYENIFSVYEACNGAEALEIITDSDIDIILCDIQMPFMNGIDFAARAKAQKPDVEIIFISGYDKFSYVKGALTLKAENYLLKPINEEEFYNTISAVLNKLSTRVSRLTESNDFIEEQIDRAELRDDDPDERAEETDDNVLLNHVKTAVQNNQPELLKEAVMTFIHKYQFQRSRSHLYIRYMCVSFLQALISYTNKADANLEDMTKEIYSFRKFSEIAELLIKTLEQTLSEMEQKSGSNSFPIQLIKKHITEHYNEDLRLTVLADLVYLSPNYLGSIFSKSEGISLTRYIRNVRMEKAVELLKNTNMKVSDVGARIGYPDTSYFCKLFQADFGVTPEKYRASL